MVAQSRGDRAFDAVVYTLLILLTLVCVYPLLYVVSASFSDPTEVNLGNVFLLPKGLNLEGYALILNYSMVWIGYRNTIFYAFFGTLLSLAVTSMAAYALSRRDLPGQGFFTFFITFTMFFGGGLVPTFLVIRQLGLYNTPWVLLILGVVSVWNVVITRTYFQTSIPFELQESAFLDGCSDARTFVQIIVPLSKPILAVMALYAIVGHWNNYFSALIYLDNRNFMPLQIFLREILIQNQTVDLMTGTDTESMILLAERVRLAETMKYCLIVVSTLPVLVIYPFVQKYFIKGVMIGAIKG